MRAPSLLGFLPLWVATEHWVEFPVLSGGSHWLSTYISAAHAWVPGPVHPVLFPRGLHLFLLSICVCFCFVNEIIYTDVFQIPLKCVDMWCLFFSFWLTSLVWQTQSPPLSLQRTQVPSFLWLSNILYYFQYVNCELPNVQAGFRKGRGTRDHIANIHWITEKANRIPEKIYFWIIDYAKDFDCVDHNKLWKILRDWNTRPPELPPEKSACRSRSNS